MTEAPEIPPVVVGSQCYVHDEVSIFADPVHVTVLWADEERMFVSQVDTVNSFYIVKRERVLTPEQVARHEIRITGSVRGRNQSTHINSR